MKLRLSRRGVVGAGFALAGAAGLIAFDFTGFAIGAEAVKGAGNPPMMRRITPSQYEQIIADVFGSDIAVGGRFDPDVRTDGLLAVGTGKISITSSGIANYEAAARDVAAQVVGEARRGLLVPCEPASPKASDDACAGQFFGKAGRLLYRRPLTDGELKVAVKAASESARSFQDFYAGLASGLSGMLSAPQFIFRTEVAEPDPRNPGEYRLDAYSKATRLSFFLWNSAPDSALIAAAESGEIHTKRGMDAQVTRMLSSPRVEAGVRAFFTDMLTFDGWPQVSKDVMIFPKFVPAVKEEAQEQTLRTIVDLLVTKDGDYRDLFTTRETFLTPLMGSVYGVPVPKITASGAPDGWQKFTFDEGDPRGTGILAHASFTALHSHPGRSSATLRGKAIREILMCQRVPDPPGNVEFKVVQDTSNPVYKTARARLNAHATDAVCAGCHRIMDPIGLALENFDSAAGYRLTENGERIDTTGVINGKKYASMQELGKVIANDPATASCLVNRVLAYAVGRAPSPNERAWADALATDFKGDNYRLSKLMKRIATSDGFYRVSPPGVETKSAEAAAGAQIARTQEIRQ